MVRRATEADLDGIERLVTAAFQRYVARIGRPPAPMTADYAELLGTSRIRVIDGTDGLCGLLVTRAECDHLLVDVVAVAPAVQGSGLGLALLERAECDARESGLAELRLCTNESMTENLAFYPRRGFHETGRCVQDGFRRVFFAKALPAPD